jgi:large subunit ribosomal protein L22
MAAVETEQKQTVRAQAKYVRSSARKARLVTDLIRGRSVPEARTILKFSDRAVARDVERVLHSAVSNAESRPDLLWSGDELRIAAAYADEGPTLKRHRARARGRVGRIMKRTCHITIELVPVPAAAGAAPETRAGRRRTARAEEPTLVPDDAVETETVEAEPPTADAPLVSKPEASGQEEPKE